MLEQPKIEGQMPRLVLVDPPQHLAPGWIGEVVVERLQISDIEADFTDRHRDGRRVGGRNPDPLFETLNERHNPGVRCVDPKLPRVVVVG